MPTLDFVEERLSCGSGLLKTVLARDIGWGLGERVFKVREHRYQGVNSINGLNVVLPPLSRCPTLFPTSHRFTLVHNYVEASLGNDYKTLLKWFPPLGPQTTAHALCDLMQQTTRQVSRQSRRRRSTVELCKFARDAFTNMGLTELAEKVHVKDGPTVTQET